MTALWPQYEDQLEALAELAEDRLDDLLSAPDGLPPAGSWIRAQHVDLDGVAQPIGPWHLVTGWNGVVGCIGVRCTSRPGWPLRYAVRRYIGEPEQWRDRRRPQLLVAPGAPAEACRRCEAALAREAAAEEAEAAARDRERTLALLPQLAAIATDASIDDAERGRRLRATWPVSAG